MSTEDLKRQTLQTVNRGIVSLGGDPLSDLPVGKPKDGDRCPIRRAFDSALPIPMYVGSSHAMLQNHGDALALKRAWGTHLKRHLPMPGKPREGFEISIPGVLKQFIVQFDVGDFPELVDPAPNEDLALMKGGAEALGIVLDHLSGDSQSA